jgi:hypothetical protein
MPLFQMVVALQPLFETAVVDSLFSKNHNILLELG